VRGEIEHAAAVRSNLSPILAPGNGKKEMTRRESAKDTNHDRYSPAGRHPAKKNRISKTETFKEKL
jgi:hypothetical protein